MCAAYRSAGLCLVPRALLLPAIVVAHAQDLNAREYRTIRQTPRPSRILTWPGLTWMPRKHVA
jgi:hypothetical protein